MVLSIEVSRGAAAPHHLSLTRITRPTPHPLSSSESWRAPASVYTTTSTPATVLAHVSHGSGSVGLPFGWRSSTVTSTISQPISLSARFLSLRLRVGTTQLWTTLTVLPASFS